MKTFPTPKGERGSYFLEWVFVWRQFNLKQDLLNKFYFFFTFTFGNKCYFYFHFAFNESQCQDNFTWNETCSSFRLSVWLAVSSWGNWGAWDIFPLLQLFNVDFDRMRSPGGLSRLEERGEWKSEEVIHKAPRTRGEEGKSKRSSKCLSISRNMNNLLAPKKNIFRTSFFDLFFGKSDYLEEHHYHDHGDHHGGSRSGWRSWCIRIGMMKQTSHDFPPMPEHILGLKCKINHPSFNNLYKSPP